MKKSTLIAIFIMAVLLFGVRQVGWGQTPLLDENFNYTAGDLLTDHGWIAHSGSGTQPITVNNGGLTFPGYIDSGIGNAALVDNTGEDDNKTFTSQSSGTVYASFMVNVTNVAAGYFFHFSTNPTVSTFRGKVFMDATNHFGVSLGSNTGTYASSTFTLGTTYLIVIKYEIVSGILNDIMSMYIFDTSFPLTEPAVPTVGPLTDVGISDIDPGAIAIRQFNASENLLIDGIRVGTSWADLVGPTLTVLPTTLTGFTYIEGFGPSSEQTFSVTGTYLTNNINITASADYEISTGTGVAFVATSPVTLTQTAGTVANTTIYTRLKAGLGAGSYNLENITLASTGATDASVQCSGTVDPQIDWANLQWPPNGNISLGSDFTVYAQVYEPGITDNANQGAGITCWIGYSNTDTDPGTWTDWVPATYNALVTGGNDEYFANLGTAISTTGTYYYASRFQFGTAPYVYGGYNSGFWNGTTNVSGILTVNSVPQIDWANLQWPPNGTISTNSIYDVYAQVYKSGVTEPAGQGAGINAWIGYSNTDTDPGTWTDWVPATYNTDIGNNDEYTANIGTSITVPGIYYYASRFQLGSAPYVYGGLGGFWNGTTSVSGVLSVAPSWTTGWPKAEIPSATTFGAKVNIDSPGTAYFVVLPSGAAAPSSAQVKAGQDASGTPLAANLKGTVACAAGNTEYTAVVAGLAVSTAYDVYFVAEDVTPVLQTAPVLISISTLAPSAPVVTSPAATSIGSSQAILGGEITNDGGSVITYRGTVWKDVTGVTILDNPLSEGGTATGSFAHLRTGMPSGVQIFFKAYATNAVGSSLSEEGSFYTLSTEPTNHVTGFAAVASGTTSIDLSWLTPSNGSYGYLVLQSTGSTAPTGLPSDATAYSIGSSIGDGTVAAIITPGTALAGSVIGLTPSTQYSFTIIPFNYSGLNTTTYNYYTDLIIPSATATTDAPPTTVYTWQGVDNGAWNIPSNWIPTRTATAATDILQFNDGTTKTVTDLQAETIGQLLLSNNTTVNLHSAAAVTLTIAGSIGTDLDIPAGSVLNLNAINAVNINLITGTSASISGNMTFSSTASTAHKLTAVDAGAIIFNTGATFTAGPFFSSNAFGNSNLNSVVFASGSTYIGQAGSNPFAAIQPNSVVVFQTGSLYKINANLTPSLSGRTYADLEIDFVGANLNTSGGAAVSIDNLTVTNGTLNFGMTGTPGHSIKGNVTIAPGGALNFTPSSAGTVNLNGTTLQIISNGGTLSFGVNSTINVANLAGIMLSSPATLNNLTLTDGIITTGVNTLTVNGNITGGSATAHVDGKLALPFAVAASKYFPIGKSGNFRPVTLNYTALDAPSTVTAGQTESALTGTLPLGATLFTDRFWTLTQTGATVFSYDITLDGTGFTPAATPVILKNDAGAISVNTTTGAPPAYTASGLTSFSDFALASYIPPPTITSSPLVLNGFGYIQGSGPSAEQTFTVSGTDLTNDISISATADYEISTTSGAGYTTPITLPQTAGTVASTTIYVRLKTGLAAGTYNGEVINITSTGAVTNTVTCSGTVINPVLSAGLLSDFGNVCINTTAGPSSFTVTGSDLSTDDVAIGALAGFAYSTTAGGTYTSILSLPQTGGAFTSTVYVQFNPTLVQSYNGFIAVAGGGAPAINVAATGSGVNTPPAVTTNSPATLVTGSSATCEGNVTDAGCAAFTARGICFGTMANPDITGSKTTEPGTTGIFSSLLSGLIPATTYHFRAYASSSITTSYGNDFTFTTLAVLPSVITDAATAVTGTGATLNGTVNANNSSTVVTFEYGTTLAYGTIVTAIPSPVTGTSGTAVSYLLGGLTPNTTYHFRVVGINIAGTANGNDLTFTTSAVLPTVVTDAATLVTQSAATLNGTVNANNASTAITFEYGTTLSYGTIVNAVPGTVTGTTNTAVSYTLGGLEPNTTYHFRVVGVNTAGTANGGDLTFTTSAMAPTVVTEAATALGATNATLNGLVNANNQTATVTFEYGFTTAYGTIENAVPNTVTGFTNTPVSVAISGLIINSTYHYRAVAVNATGTTYGDDMSFSTNCIAPDPAGIISGPAMVCQTASGVTYSVGTINLATSYVWTVPAGATIVSGTGTSIILVNFGANAASGDISVYGTSACGDGMPSSLPVTVSALPVPVIIGSPTACVTATNNIYTTESGMTSYTWTVSAGGLITAGDGTNAITVTWNTLGPKTVTVNYTNAGGCTAPAATTLNVTVNTIPSPSLAGSTELCAGTTGVIYTTDAGYSNYVWTVSYGGTITSGLNTNEVTVTWATAGTRSITANYANTSGCSATTPASLSVTVLSVPAPLITGDNEVCEGATGVTYTTQPNNSNYSWVVSPGGTITSGAGSNSISVNWTGNGNQTVSVDFTNNLGCGSIEPTVYNVMVDPKPAAAGTITGTSTVCAGTLNVAYSVPAIANAIHYNWTLPSTGAVISSGEGTNSITVSYALTATSGIMRVSGVNDCGTGAGSPGFNVVVNPIPATPVISQNGDTLTSSATSGNQWYLDGVTIPGATGQQHVAVYTGTYSVVVTLSGCSSEPSNSILVLPVSVRDVNLSRTLEIYPNPSNGQFNLFIRNLNTEEYSIEIYNNLGALVWKQENVTISGTYTSRVDLSGSPSGIYMVALRNKANSIVKKAVIMN